MPTYPTPPRKQPSGRRAKHCEDHLMHELADATAGQPFDYKSGDWMGLQVEWSDARRRLRLRLADGSRMHAPRPRPIEVRLVPGKATRRLSFDGSPLDVQL